MMKKTLSLLLVIGMLLTCVPLGVWAEDEPAEEPEQPVWASEPAEAPDEEPAPETQAPAEEPAPETEAPAEDPAPETQAPAEDPAPETQAPAEDPAPETEAPAEEPAPETDEPAEEPAPETDGPAEEPEPASDEPAEEEERPGEEEDMDLLAVPFLTETNFPDYHFRLALYNNGILTSADAVALTALDVSGCSIEDLTGIHLFSNLRSLNCSDNDLSALSLSSLRYLEGLDCSYNASLVYLSVKSCRNLVYADASHTALASADVSGLRWLDTLLLSSTPLTTLKISGCDSLSTLTFPMDKLVTFEAEDCTGLITLDMTGATSLVTLDVKNCPALQSLTVDSAKLSTLRVAGCSALLSLDCHNTSLLSLDLTGCTALLSLDCSFCLLTSLTVRSCPNLAAVDCSGNFLKTLSLPYMSSLTYLNCDANELTVLDLTGCMALETLCCGDNYLSELTLTDCFSLKTLTCQDNRLSVLDLNKLATLVSLDCSGNELSELAIEACTGLTELNCKDNRLLRLDATAVAGLSTVELGEQHPAATLTAYLPDEEYPAYAFADLRELITEAEKSIVSTGLPHLGTDEYLPVITVGMQTLTYTLDYTAVQMQVTVSIAYEEILPVTSRQEYILLDRTETLPGLNAFLDIHAFSGASVFGVDWAAFDPPETAYSTVIAVSGDQITAQKSGSAVLYAYPYLSYASLQYYFTPIRIRVDVGVGPGDAAAEVTGISVPESDKTVELFSTAYTTVELLLERNALKSAASSGRLIEDTEIEPVNEFIHTVTNAVFTDLDAADIFDLKIVDDRTLAIVPKYIVLQAAWYQPRFVRSTYRTEIAVTLSDGSTFVTNRLKLSVKQSKPSVSAKEVSIDTLDIFSGGAQTAFPIRFTSSARVLAAEPDPDRKTPLPAWLSLDGNGLEFIYAGDEAFKDADYAYLLVTLEGWAIKVPVKIRVRAVCSLVMRFRKKHLYVRADGADSDLVAFTTTPLSVRGIDFFRDNAELSEAVEKGVSYDPADLFDAVEYYDAATGYYGWHLQVKYGSPADDGKAHTYTVSLTVADRTVYFYVKVYPFMTRPQLTLKRGGTVDMGIPGSSTEMKLTLTNMNLNAEDGYGAYLVQPVFHITLASPYGTDVTGEFQIGLDRKTGTVTVTAAGSLGLSRSYYAFLWAEVNNGGLANAKNYGRFSVKESAPNQVRPSFSFRRSGTIDTARADSYLRLMPKVKNFPLYDVNEVTFTFYRRSGKTWTEMTDWYHYFDVVTDTADRCFYIAAADPFSYPLTPGNGYGFTAKWKLGGTDYYYGTAASPRVLPVRQNRTQFTASVSKDVLSRLDGYADTLLTFTPKTDDINPVSYVTLDSAGAKYFTVTATEIEGVFRLGWNKTAPRSKLRAGATRTVTLRLFLEGNNTSKPNATVKVRIKLA